ncbi:hypothetical protein SDC9_179485 [bioreactor metagenome]|uniref:Uncharacterized protein n=1 Tax=bioreactor metagenome TaxID=1076179 RepID=A0A645H013_9ZZZZ
MAGISVAVGGTVSVGAEVEVGGDVGEMDLWGEQALTRKIDMINRAKRFRIKSS